MHVNLNLKMLIKTFLLVALYSSIYADSSLNNVLRSVDDFFISSNNANVESVQELIKRSHNLPSRRQKRESTQYNDFHHINGFDSVIFSDSKFPVDLNSFEAGGKTYFVSLHDSLSRGGQSNAPILRIEKLDNGKGELLEWIQFQSVGKVEVQNINDDIIIAITQPQEGNISGRCLIYQLQNINFKQIQKLDVGNPKDVQLFDNNNEVYLAISREMDVMIFKWRDSYFDKVQQLASHQIISMSFFNIDGTLHLATVGKSTYPEANCWIWQLNLDTDTFECKQNAEPYTAVDVKYFQLKDFHSYRRSHFIAVGYENKPSIVYKMEDNLFQPFQMFYNKNHTRWLPYKVSTEDKILFSVSEKGVDGYIYDGWRFKRVQMDVSNTSFGEGCKSIRSVKNINGPWLIGINNDKQIGEVVKPSFNLSKIDKSPLSVKSWCDSLINYDNQPIENLQNYMNSVPMTDKPVVFNGDATFRNVKINKLTTQSFGTFNKDLVEEINSIYKVFNDIELIKNDIEQLLLIHSSDSTIFIKEEVTLNQLTIKPSSIASLFTNFLNNEDINTFQRNAVRLSRDTEGNSMVVFNELTVGNLSTNFINGRPAQNMIYLHDNLQLSQVTVNGNLSFHTDVKIKGAIQGVTIDRDHVVLVDGNQTLPGQLLLRYGNINNLNMAGTLNFKNMDDIMNENATDLPTSWDILNVLNLTIDGSLVGPNIEKKPTYDTSDNPRYYDSVEVSTGILSGVNISDLVRIDQGSYKLNSEITFDEEMEIDNLNVLNSVNELQLENLLELLSDSTMRSSKDSNEPITLRNLVGDDIIVKGAAVLSDIVSDVGHSLSTIKLANQNGTSYNDSYVKEPEADVGADNDEYVCENEKSKSRKNFKKITKSYDESGNIFYEIYGGLTLESVYSNELTVSGGYINELNWTDLVTDAARKNEMTLITGTVIIDANLQDVHLNVDGHINEIVPEQFVHKLIHNSYLIFNETIEVTENIIVNGKSIFEDSSDDNKSDVIVNNVNFLNGVTVNEINNIHINDFISNAVYKNRNMSLDTVNFIDNLEADEIQVSGLVNGASFNKQLVLLKNSSYSQILDSRWGFRSNLVIDGNLTVIGEINGMKADKLCDMIKADPRIIIDGSIKSLKEPTVVKTINNVEKSQLISDLWFKNKKSVLGGNVKLSNVQMWEPIVLKGRLNNCTMDQISKGYLSKTIPRVMRAPLFISNLTATGPVRANHVTGHVNDMNITDFAASVLQHDVEQNFTVSPEFEEVHLTALNSGLIDGLNFSKDVLRYDVENAVVTGTKTIDNVKVNRLDLPSKVQLQGVNMAEWVKDAVLKTNPVVKGNVSFSNIQINGVLSVDGQVGPLDFNSQNLLTVNGTQKILGLKTFLAPIEMTTFEGNGFINDVDIKKIIKLSESNGSVVLSSPVEVENIEGNLIKVNGDIKGVNLSEFCGLSEERLTINDLNAKYFEVANSAHSIYENIAHGAYYLDHYKVMQKFRTNVSALARLPGNAEIIAIFRQFPNENNVSLLFWDSRSHIFKPSQDKVIDELLGNVTIVSSGSDFLYAEKWKHGGHVFYKNHVHFINSSSATCAIPFETNNHGLCIFLGQDSQADQMFCSENKKAPMKVIQKFRTHNCLQASTVKTEKITWLAVIGSKMSRSSSEIGVTVFSLRDGQILFNPRQDLPVLHPVSVSAISHGGHSYLVVASKHQPESVRSSLLSIFRYSSNMNKWIRYQEIPAEAPLEITFEKLPTGQLALYVLTANPARAFLVYLYKGVEGFVEETAGFATHSGSTLSAFHVGDTNFVAIVGKGYGQLLQAELRGRRFK